MNVKADPIILKFGYCSYFSKERMERVVTLEILKRGISNFENV